MRNDHKESAILKRNQLEREIRESGATPTEKANMQHTLSKLWMFASEGIDDEATRADRAEVAAGEWKERCIDALGRSVEPHPSEPPDA